MSVPYSEGRNHFTLGLDAARRIRGICWASAVRPSAEMTVSIPVDISFWMGLVIEGGMGGYLRKLL